MVDQSIIGLQFPEFRFRVEEGKIAEFARAIHCTDPCHFDLEAARELGFSAQPAPPTFSTASMHWQPPQGDDALGLDLERVLAGGNEWEYIRPMVAGEEFTVRTHIADVSKKQGSRGEMTLILREMGFYDANDELVLIARSTIIELPPSPAISESEVYPT